MASSTLRIFSSSSSFCLAASSSSSASLSTDFWLKLELKKLMLTSWSGSTFCYGILGSRADRMKSGNPDCGILIVVMGISSEVSCTSFKSALGSVPTILLAIFDGEKSSFGVVGPAVSCFR